MEASDAFTQTTEIGPEDDPFAGSDFGDFGETEVTGDAVEAAAASELADVPIATEGLPVVDREGQPVDPTPPPASAGPTEEEKRAAEAAAYRESHGEPEPVAAQAAPVVPPGEPQPEQTFDPASGTMKPAPLNEAALAQGRVEPTVESPPQPAPPAAQEPPAPVAEQPPAPAPAAESAPQAEADPTPAASNGATGSTTEAELAAPPEPTQSASGKTTRRRYLVFRVTEPGKFEQIAWYEAKDGTMLTERQPGAKRQAVALCRGTEDALKIGYAAVGSPPQGVNLVAVAEAYFQPKPVRPKAPEPTRQRLQIG